MLCSDNDKATYTISDIALEYDVIINAEYTGKGMQSPAREFIPIQKSEQNYLTK